VRWKTFNNFVANVFRKLGYVANFSRMPEFWRHYLWKKHFGLFFPDTLYIPSNINYEARDKPILNEVRKKVSLFKRCAFSQCLAVTDTLPAVSTLELPTLKAGYTLKLFPNKLNCRCQCLHYIKLHESQCYIMNCV